MATLAILGAAGRMGGALIRCSQRTGDWTLVAAVEQPDHADLGQNAGALAAAAGIDVPITADLAAAAAGKPFVLGTTGLTDAEAAAVRDAARKIPLVWAPNMSLGVNLLFAMVRQAASVLGPDYRVEIDETHHIHKKDAPSGTALQLGRKIAEGKNADFNDLYVHDPDGAGQLRAADKLVIRSHRKGEVVGDHTASFENEGERIEFTHLARSRDAFAMGALHAAAWALGRRPGLYDMQDVLGLQ